MFKDPTYNPLSLISKLKIPPVAIEEGQDSAWETSWWWFEFFASKASQYQSVTKRILD